MTSSASVGAVAVAVAAVSALAGCAWCRVKPPEIPATLRPPAEQRAFLQVRATGVQIYECTSKPDAPGTFTWTFQAPEATLADRSGHIVGRHYAGPTWELQDGSRVVGEVTGRDPGPDPAAIPWLLLRAKSTSGTGALTRTQSILRVHTVGGVAPGTPCTEAQAHSVARVPYTGDYYFYAERR
jgi:FtsP/CotA-like multicopper oxidase with cupredoxin domain